MDNPRCPGGFCTRLGECAECNPQQEEIDNPLCPSGTFCTGNSFLDPQAGTCTSTPPTGADLSIITKTDVPDPVTVGTPLTYTVQFMNNGPEPATNITFTDRLPAGVTFMSASKDCSEAGDTVTCEVVSLESGASVGVEIVVLPTVVGTLTNTARVTSTTPDPFPDNNERTEETIVTPPAPPPADLAIISKTDVPDPVTVGTLLLYTVQVVNNGPEIATEVTITDRLPAEATFFSASEICRPVNGTVICELGSLESGASTEVFIVVLPTVVGTITNTAQVMSTTFDPNPDNNERTEDTTVIAFAPGQEADVAFLEKRDMPDPVTVGTPLTYNLSFINNGPGTATLITITDTLPTGVTFVSASGGCQEANGTVTCQFGNIGSGTRFGPIIVVLPTVVGTLTNTARVMSTAPDPNPNNNIGTEDTTVIPPTPGQVIVNELIDFDPLRDTFATTPDPTGCPAGFVGTFSFAARLPNVSDRPLAALQVLVVTLTNGNLLQNADGGPGGVGAILTVPAVNGFADDLLSPGEFVDVPFVICLTRIEPFIFLVNVLGVVLP